MPEQDSNRISPVPKLVIEFGPLALFFVTQRAMDLMWATAVLMVAISASLIASRRIENRWPTVPLITAVFVITLGSLTLWFGDATFIKVKPTIVNALFALILLGGLARGRLFLRTVFRDAFELQEDGWRKLTIRFGIFFIGLAVLNEVVWRTQTEDVWVNFKVFGIAPLSIVFMLCQSRLLQRHAVEKDDQAEDGESGRGDSGSRPNTG